MPDKLTLADVLRLRKSNPLDYDIPPSPDKIFGPEKAGYKLSFEGGKYTVYAEPTIDGIEERALALELSAREIGSGISESAKEYINFNKRKFNNKTLNASGIDAAKKRFMKFFPSEFDSSNCAELDKLL